MFAAVRFNKIIVLAAVLCIIFSTAICVFIKGADKKAAGSYSAATLVIDPGHGGIDGGAIAADGTKESAINLAIAQKMAAIAGFYGKSYVMTRDTEESSVSIAEYSEHADLVRRAELANSTPGGVLISIHQNNYPAPEPMGAEVMFAATNGSRELGELAQKNIVSMADPEDRRVASPAPAELLLTSSVTCPAILAECGFMSNPQEAGKLGTDVYQTKLSCALTAAYILFSQGGKSV